MKIKVIKPFADIETREIYKVGTELDFETKRAEKAISMEFAVSMEEKKTAKKKED